MADKEIREEQDLRERLTKSMTRDFDKIFKLTPADYKRMAELREIVERKYKK